MVSMKKNIFYNSLFQIAVLLVPFITTPYVSRVLGAENIGKYSYATAMVTYFTLFATLGTNLYGQRKIAACKENAKEVNRVFWNVEILRIILAILALILYGSYLFFFEGINAINGIAAISLLNVAIDVSWLFQGLEEFKITALRNLLVRLGCLAGIFLFVKDQNDTWKYILIIMLSQFMGNFSMVLSARRYVKWCGEIQPFEGFWDIVLIFLPTISIQVYTILDKSMIGWITHSDYANGCYEQSERIARLALSVVTSVGSVVYSRVANLFHKDDLEQARGYVYKAFQLVWLMAVPVMMGLNAVSNLFIPIFLGKDFGDAIILLKIFSALILIVGTAHVIGVSYLIPTKQQNVYTFAVTIAAIFNFLMNLILIPLFGALGAAIASIVAETIGTAIQLAYCFMKKQLCLTHMIKNVWKYCVAGMVMYVGVVFLRINYFSEGFGALTILIASGVIMYLGMIILIRDSFFIEQSKNIIDNMSKILNKKRI